MAITSCLLVVQEILSASPTVFTIGGLFFDACGAVLLIGINWQRTLDFGMWIRPDFARLQRGMLSISDPSSEDLKPGDDGFEELFELCAPDGSALPSGLHQWSPSRIAPVDSPRGEVTFVFKDERGFHDEGTEKYPVELVKEMADSRVQRWFTKRAVALLVGGFALQIVAQLIPIIAPLILA